MKPESSLPFSQKPATGTYPEPDKFSPYFHTISLSSILVSLMEVFWVVGRVIFWLYANVSEGHTASIFSPEDGDSMFLQNADIQPKYYTMQQHRRPPTVFTSP
jgi:hypothetical protein